MRYSFGASVPQYLAAEDGIVKELPAVRLSVDFSTITASYIGVVNTRTLQTADVLRIMRGAEPAIERGAITERLLQDTRYRMLRSELMTAGYIAAEIVLFSMEVETSGSKD